MYSLIAICQYLTAVFAFIDTHVRRGGWNAHRWLVFLSVQLHLIEFVCCCTTTTTSTTTTTTTPIIIIIIIIIKRRTRSF